MVVAVVALLRFWVLNFVVIPKSKSIHFTKFQDMFNPRGSRADYVFGDYFHGLDLCNGRF